MTIISTHLKYMNTSNLKNIFALLDIHDFAKCEIHISAQWKIIF